MYSIMDTKDSADVLMSQHAEHVIMSEGLSIDLGEMSAQEQYFLIDDNRFVCDFRRIKAFKDKTWEIELEVPGLDLENLVNFSSIVFVHNNVKFVCEEEFEFSKNEGFQSILILNAKRMVSNHE